MSDRSLDKPQLQHRPSMDNRERANRDLVESFDAMALNGSRERNKEGRRYSEQNGRSGFVGGFDWSNPSVSKPLPSPPRPGFPPYPSPHINSSQWPPPYSTPNGPTPPGSNHIVNPNAVPPPPVLMPEPQHLPPYSRTMQFAMDPSGPATPPRAESNPQSHRKQSSGPTLVPPPPPPNAARPHSDSKLPPAAHASSSDNKNTNADSKSRTPQPSRIAVPPSQRLRAHSTPPSPIAPIHADPSSSSNALDAASSTQVQCSGVTKAGKRCTRQVKVDSAMQDGTDVFCFQHAKEVLAPSGLYDRKTGTTFIKFADWIPDYLQPSTQASLRAEMEKARSHTDEPGYIYTFEIRDSDTPSLVHLKVGRANNLNRRIDQWGKQCGSKEQILRGFWPGGVVHDETNLLKGRVNAGEKGAWCHRVERLVHLELADLAINTPYLEKGWPNVGAPAPASGKDKDKKDIKRCPDCGTAHKEIFTFAKVKSGRYKDREWDLIVKPVIEKWGGWSEAYL